MVTIKPDKEPAGYFLSCDWGTSAFRLYLVRRTDGEIVESISSHEGVKAVFEKWQANPAISRELVFRNVLKDQIGRLAAQSTIDIRELPVVASGMIGSSIGWSELPCAELPFPADGRSIKTLRIPAEATFSHEVVLISGVRKGTQDIMRGEETQLAGLVEMIDQADGCFIFPGTHSKHLFLNGGEIVDFKTFMTGELFAVISEHSILKSSLQKENTLNEASFIAGVESGMHGDLLHELFSIRSRSVTTGAPVSPDYLSGLLIGQEIKTLRNEEKIIICGADELTTRYQLALHYARPGGRLQAVAPEIMAKSVPAGQEKILNHLQTH